MNNKPRISVVMPMYNASAYLREALESVLLQTFTDFELLVIDDGSTDDGVEIVKSYKDERIRLLTGTHNFISNLNRGINAAAGKYTARMDADDVMLSHRLETQFSFMEKHSEIDICGSWVVCFGAERKILRAAAEHCEIIALLLLSNPLVHPSVMMRRSVFEHIPALYSDGYPCAEDYKLWTILAGKGFRFANIQEALLRYRRYPSQVTQCNYDIMRESATRIRMEYARQVMNQITTKEKRYIEFFGRLAGLFSDGLLDADGLFHTVYCTYSHFLKKICVMRN